MGRYLKNVLQVILSDTHVFIFQNGVKDILEGLQLAIFISLPYHLGAWGMGPAVLLAILCLGVAEVTQSSDPSLDSEWQEWKRKFNKNYSMVSSMNIIQPDFRENGTYWDLWVQQSLERPL